MSVNNEECEQFREQRKVLDTKPGGLNKTLKGLKLKRNWLK